MMGRTHALTGTAAGLGVSLYLAHLSLVPTIAGTLICTGSALLPDMDHPRATAANAYGPITRTMSWVVRTVSGGHRRGTHSVFGIMVLGGTLLFAGTVCRYTVPAQAWISLVVILALASMVRLLKIPGILDDLAPIPIVVGIVFLTNTSLAIIPWAVMLGCLIHTAGDMMTKEGAPIFWPFISKSYKLADLRTNGLTERYLVLPLVTITIVTEIVWKVLDTAR